LSHGQNYVLRELRVLFTASTDDVLHDEMVMELTPRAYDPFDDEEWAAQGNVGPRNVIIAFGPTLGGYDFFKCESQKPVPEILLSAALIQVASKYANATEGDVYYEAHVDHLKRVLGNVSQGGSVLMRSDFGREAIATAQRYPELLFQHLAAC
jgi:hypothetical protein